MPLLIKATIKVNTAEPITDQMIGKVFPPILMAKISGKPNLPASHRPMYAPINPTTIDTRQPPRS